MFYGVLFEINIRINICYLSFSLRWDYVFRMRKNLRLSFLLFVVSYLKLIIWLTHVLFLLYLFGCVASLFSGCGKELFSPWPQNFTFIKFESIVISINWIIYKKKQPYGLIPAWKLTWNAFYVHIKGLFRLLATMAFRLKSAKTVQISTLARWKTFQYILERTSRNKRRNNIQIIMWLDNSPWHYGNRSCVHRQWKDNIVS